MTLALGLATPMRASTTPLEPSFPKLPPQIVLNCSNGWRQALQ